MRETNRDRLRKKEERKESQKMEEFMKGKSKIRKAESKEGVRHTNNREIQ